jgi:hypothetical protein
MARILLSGGEVLELTRAEAIQYITDSNLHNVFGFGGTEDWIGKLAYYAGEKKFGRDNPGMRAAIATAKSLNDYLFEIGKLTAYQYNELKKN